MGRKPVKPSIEVYGSKIMIDLVGDRHSRKALQSYIYSLSSTTVVNNELVEELRSLYKVYCGGPDLKRLDMVNRSEMRVELTRMMSDAPDEDFTRAELLYLCSQNALLRERYKNLERTMDSALRWMENNSVIERVSYYREPKDLYPIERRTHKAQPYTILAKEQARQKEKSKELGSYGRALVLTDVENKVKVLKKCKNLKLVFGHVDNDYAIQLTKEIGAEYRYQNSTPKYVPDDVLLIS